MGTVHLKLRKYSAKRTFACSVALIAMVSGTAQAQEVSPSSDNTGQQVADEPSREIVVTARKREENLRDVPIAITALPDTVLQEKNVARLTDLVTIVPTFTVNLTSPQPVAFIRGFGSGGNQSFEQSVGKFVDNVSYGRDFHARIPLFDLQQVEVLKGPQVLLYGNSTTAGALNITTKKPGSTLSIDSSAAYEFVNDEVLLNVGITLPISDRASLRVAGFAQDLSRGWIYNIATGRHEPTTNAWGVRPTLRLEPLDGMTVTLKAEVARVRDKGGTAQPVTQSTLPSRRMAEVEYDHRRNTNYNVAPFFYEEYNSLDAETYQADVEYDAGGVTIASTTAFLKSHFGTANGNGAEIPTVIIALDQDYEQFSQELRLSGRTGALDYLIGGYYQDDTFRIHVPQSFDLAPYGLPVPRFSRFATLDQFSKNYSVFGNLVFNLNDQFSAEAGARYSIVRKSSDQSNNPANFISNVRFGFPRSAGTSQLNPAFNGVFTSILGGIPHTFFDIKTREEHLQPQVILKYRPTNLNMLYAKFVKGDKSGGVDFLYAGSVARGANPQDAQFQPEKATSFEIGFKGVTPGGDLEYNLTAFSTTFDNLQTGVFLGTAVFTTNAGRARTRGVEADFTWTVNSEFRINGAAAYQDAKYVDYAGGTCTIGQTNAGTCSPATGGQDLSGHRLPFSSKYTVSAALDYRKDIEGTQIGANASAIYKSSYNTSLNDDPLADQDGFATVDASLSVTPAGSGFTLALFGRNLTNQSYKEYGVAQPLIPGGFLIFRSRARQMGVRLSSSF